MNNKKSRQGYEPIGRRVDVGGHCLHAYVTGEHGPVVVLEAGGGSWCMDWSAVQPELARFARVVSYDRAGLGWSDRGPLPRSAAQMLRELRALLAALELAPPYILVGASFGGHVARLFADSYPTEVAGLVLLDARQENLAERMPPNWTMQQKIAENVYPLMAKLARWNLLGLASALMGKRARPPALKILPANQHDMYLKMGYRPEYFETCLDELHGIDQSDQELRATGSLGDLPLVVIRHGLPDLFEGLPNDQAQQAEHTWQELQSRLARLSTRGRLLVAEHSGHAIAIEQPEIVVDAVREVAGV